MLVHESWGVSSSRAREIADTLLAVCGQQESYFDRQLHSWYLQGYPDLVLMQGMKVGVHHDGGAFWQPMMILRNDGWVFSGSRQYRLYPPTPGTQIVLDIERLHQVRGRGKTPWLALCWNPGQCVPKKQDYSLGEVVYQLSQAIKNLGKTEESA